MCTAKAVYQKAKENFDKLIKENVLQQDAKPNYYLYQQIMDGRAQTGLVACSSVADYFDDKIKKHEFTRPEKELGQNSTHAGIYRRMLGLYF